MSVRTTADERIDTAKELIEEIVNKLKEATELISEALDKETWGSGDYGEKYVEKLELAEVNLAKLRVDLKIIERSL